MPPKSSPWGALEDASTAGASSPPTLPGASGAAAAVAAPQPGEGAGSGAPPPLEPAAATDATYGAPRRPLTASPWPPSTGSATLSSPTSPIQECEEAGTTPLTALPSRPSPPAAPVPAAVAAADGSEELPSVAATDTSSDGRLSADAGCRFTNGVAGERDPPPPPTDGPSAGSGG